MEQRLLVGEVMVERAARHACRRDDVGRRGLGVALFDEQASRAAFSSAARVVSVRSRLERRPDSCCMHTACMLITETCRLYVNDRRKESHEDDSLLSGDPDRRCAGTSAFYQAHFRFRALFDSGWYVHLQSAEDKRVNLGIVAGRSRDDPGGGRGRVSGLILNFEVKDPDVDLRTGEGGRAANPAPACATRNSASGISSPSTPTA